MFVNLPCCLFTEPLQLLLYLLDCYLYVNFVNVQMKAVCIVIIQRREDLVCCQINSVKVHTERCN